MVTTYNPVINLDSKGQRNGAAQEMELTEVVSNDEGQGHVGDIYAAWVLRTLGGRRDTL